MIVVTLQLRIEKLQQVQINMHFCRKSGKVLVLFDFVGLAGSDESSFDEWLAYIAEER